MGFALHTVFLARENLHFLEEWLLYHIYLGVEHIYIYDNTGSCNVQLTHSILSDGKNRHGIPVADLTSNLSDEDVERYTKSIVARFSSSVTLVPWAPQVDGVIRYGQTAAIRDCLRRFGGRHEWMGFFDMDEFLFSPSNDTMDLFLDEVEKEGATRLFLYQKKFEDRFLNKARLAMEHSLVTEIFGCMSSPVFRSRKIILKCKDFDPDVRPYNVHQLPVSRGGDKSIPMEIFRFNHYNFNQAQIDWLVGKAGFPAEEVLLDGVDEGMSRYSDILREHVFETGFGRLQKCGW